MLNRIANAIELIAAAATVAVIAPHGAAQDREKAVADLKADYEARRER